MLIYKEKALDVLTKNLTEHLKYLKRIIIGGNISSIDEFFNNLSVQTGHKENVLHNALNHISKEFQLTDPVLFEKRIIPEGVIITIKDIFEEKITALIDINGIIKRIQRITK